MQLSKKKALAARVLNVGKGKIVFAESSLSEIKEAITRQDILDLYNAGAIKIKEVSGRRKITKRRNRKGTGKVRKKIKAGKRDYVIMTRKLRTYAKYLLKTKKINNEKYRKIRQMVKGKKFKSKRHLNEILEEI